jgi:hypothetical protein
MNPKFLFEKLNAWLEKPIYWDGVEIYKEHGSVAYLKSYLQNGSESHRKKLLTDELTKMRDALAEQIQEEEEAMPAVLSDRTKYARSLMDERFALKERARLLYSKGITEGSELKEIASRIVTEINTELDEIHGMEAFWKANKFMPVSAPTAVVYISDLVRRRNNLRTYISKGTNDPGKLKAWQSELLDLDNRINAIQNSAN